MLLRETRIDRIEDHGLDHHSVFTADAFAGTIVATRVPEQDVLDDRVPVSVATAALPASPTDALATSPTDALTTLPADNVSVRLYRKAGDPLEFRLRQADLPLVPSDLRAPWLLAPPDAVAAFRRMQKAGPPLGRRYRVRRGVFTGANDVLLIRDAAPRLGGLAWIRAEGRFAKGRRRKTGRSAWEALVESCALAPVLKGAGVRAWRFRLDGHVVWSYDRDGRFHEPPVRLAAWLETHSSTLSARSGNPGSPAALFRVSKDALGPKVVWHDLADRLEAVAVPAATRTTFGRWAPVVPLNTVYFIPAADDAEARLLAGVLNSLPVRCFARAIAERAKDARFRFFAWTIATLPLPELESSAGIDRIRGIADAAHEAGSIDVDANNELDAIVADMYRLDPADVAAIRSFDDWLSGRDP
jgi:hypothetical protein